MRIDSRPRWPVAAAAAALLVCSVAAAGPPEQRGGASRPTQSPADRAAGEALTRKLCGVTCHPFEHVVAIRRTRAQWEASVENMIGRGAQGTSTEFAAVLEYLAANHALTAAAGGGLGAGPNDLPIVDSRGAAIGKTFYSANCEGCHGADARGTPKGTNLVRSGIVLRDRYGSALGPYLRNSHPPIATIAKPAELTGTQVLGLAHFVRDRVNDTLRGSPIFKPGDILTGDAKAGAAYFNGEGGCAQCHSPAGDLAGIGRRLDPVTLQQRFLFPSNAGSHRRQTPAPFVTVTVTTASGETLEGRLVHMDDFTVALRDATGAYRSVRRATGVRVVKHDPFAAHIALLPRITDKAIHDVVAYLETLK
jgi:cytochrome c oxidase cbb3-type subunit III